MKLRDFIVPRWRHSDPEIRAMAVAKIKDAGLLEQIKEKDASPAVREVAAARLTTISQEALIR